MDTRNLSSGICWSCATLMAVAAFLLVLAAIDLSAHIQSATVRIVLVALAATALFVMGVLVTLAFRIERARRS